MITEGHDIEPDTSLDLTPANHLGRLPRSDHLDASLLTTDKAPGEDELLTSVDSEPDDSASG